MEHALSGDRRRAPVPHEQMSRSAPAVRLQTMARRCAALLGLAALLAAGAARAAVWAPDAFASAGGANAGVYTVAQQSDGKLLIGGGFTQVAGIARSRIARLLADGTLDPDFDPGAGFDGDVQRIVVQADGRILVAGGFTGYDGTPRSNIARLLADGSIDVSFDPGSGANNGIAAMALQGDGRIVIGGSFTQYAGVGRNRVARINADGSLDTTYTPGVGANNALLRVVLQGDGKAVVAGWFTSMGGSARNYLARLNVDGSLDTTFNTGTGPNAVVTALGLQPDGKLLIAGNFSSVNGTPRTRIARVEADGTLDAGFVPGAGLDGGAEVLLPQADGTAFAAGFSSTYDGTPREGLVRILANGALDSSFELVPGTGYHTAAVVTAGGRILVGGFWNTVYGVARGRIARLAPTQAVVFPAPGAPSVTLPQGGSFGIGPLATADSGLAVVYSSLTPTVCTVTGSTVRVVADGICTVAADQPGDATWMAAAQATQSIEVTLAAPVPVPTLHAWALLLLGLALPILAARAGRRADGRMRAGALRRSRPPSRSAC